MLIIGRGGILYTTAIDKHLYSVGMEGGTTTPADHHTFTSTPYCLDPIYSGVVLNSVFPMVAS